MILIENLNLPSFSILPICWNIHTWVHLTNSITIGLVEYHVACLDLSNIPSNWINLQPSIILGCDEAKPTKKTRKQQQRKRLAFLADDSTGDKCDIGQRRRFRNEITEETITFQNKEKTKMCQIMSLSQSVITVQSIVSN